MIYDRFLNAGIINVPTPVLEFAIGFLIFTNSTFYTCSPCVNEFLRPLSPYANLTKL